MWLPGGMPNSKRWAVEVVLWSVMEVVAVSMKAVAGREMLLGDRRMGGRTPVACRVAARSCWQGHGRGEGTPAGVLFVVPAVVDVAMWDQ